MCRFVLPVIMGTVMLVCLLLGGAEVFAQGSPSGNTSVDFESIVQFGSLFESIKTTIAPLVAAALTLGLAIWGASYIFSIVKRMAR